jgi:protein-S-isoprenylcysteine O-methyltransferase Ste14
MNFAKVNMICWGAFFLVWLIGAIYNSYKGPQVTKRTTNSWRLWLIGLVIVWILKRIVPYHIWFSLRWNMPILQIIGVIVLVAGTLFTLWARVALGTMWSSSITLKSDHVLRTYGPYRITRHPIYTGMLTMLIGSTLTTGVIFVPVFIVAVLILFIKIRNEEKLMIETFGQQYLDFRQRVPQLIPGLRWNLVSPK